MPQRVLVTRHLFEEAIDLLRPHVDLDYHDSHEDLGAEALRARIRDRHGLVCQLTDTIDATLLDAAPELKVIANVAVGYDNIDVDRARRRGIEVTNTPDVLTETTADLAFGLLLAAARRIPEAERFLRAGRWHRWEVDLLCGRDVHGRTLGLVGFGRIGRAVARRARGFGMRVLYHDPEPLAREQECELGVEHASLDRILEESDFVSLHVPLTEATRHLIGAAELARMKRDAILVNTTRGPVVDEAALADALEKGEIAGAGLDVFENEPEVHPRLLRRDDVVLLPHVGSASIATRRRMCRMAAENCLAVLRREPPLNPVP